MTRFVFTLLIGLVLPLSLKVTTSSAFESLNPHSKRVLENKNALALIVGVADYENTQAKAIFADNDAKVFENYAREKLGVPSDRIITLTNEEATYPAILEAMNSLLAIKPVHRDRDVYVFFAGHSLASDDGQKMYFLPYDGEPNYLELTAVSKQVLFDAIASVNYRSVNVFLDTSYSGTTRDREADRLTVGRGELAYRRPQFSRSIPDNFTVFAAVSQDQTAKPLEETKHGMFSYFLMKGMEGDADQNLDNKITAGELHEYVKENVWQQSSNKQLPELQGDANRVLVQFQ